MAGVLGFMLLTVGCSFGTSSSGSANKTLIVETAFQIDTMDPNAGVGRTIALLATQMYDTLVRPDPADTTVLKPLLAQSFAPSPDGLSVTFKLRHDVKFSDGTPLTSADVVFSLQRLKYVNGAATGQVMNGLTAVASDPYTVVVTSDHPNVFIAASLSQPQASILNSKVVQANGGKSGPDAVSTDTAGTYLNQQSAGSGPYQLVSSDLKVQIEVKANPNYWGSNKPVYSKVILRNEAVSAQLLDVQQADSTMALDLSPQQASTADKSKVNIFTKPSLDVFALMLNANPAVSPTLANPMVRQAIRYAIDYKALVQLAGVGAVQAQGMLATGIPGSLPANELVTRDVTKAKSLLAQSGVTNPTILMEYQTDVTFYGLGLADLAQLIQANLKDVGITVTLQASPKAIIFPRWFGGKIQMFLYPLGGNNFVASSNTKFQPGAVVAKWMGWQAGMDPASDAAWAKIAASTDPAQTAALYQEQERASNAVAVLIPLFRSPYVTAASKSVGGLNLNSVGTFFFTSLT